MSRIIEVTVTPAQRGRFVDRIRGCDGIAGIVVHEGASILPPGDVVSVRASNEAVEAVVEAIGRLGIAETGTVTIDEPNTLLAPAQREAIVREGNEASWEEMEALLRRDTNLSINYLVLMTLAGAIAGVGLIQDELHIVVGAMLVAPGFEPLLRIVFGPVSGAWQAAWRGVLSASFGYLLLALGAALATLIVLQIGPPVPPDPAHHEWIAFWTSAAWPDVVVALLAGLAGAIIINSQRTVFAAGVMVALALVPSMAIAGMGLAVGDLGLARDGFVRWAIDAACVLATGSAVMLAKRVFMHPRRALS